jgi:c-di-GMP-related signal transduction protein
MSELSISERVKSALDYQGMLGIILRLADAMEKDAPAEVSYCLNQLNLKSSVLKPCVENAYTWAAYA